MVGAAGEDRAPFLPCLLRRHLQALWLLWFFHCPRSDSEDSCSWSCGYAGRALNWKSPAYSVPDKHGIQSEALRRALPHSCCQWQWHRGSRNAEIKASLLIPVYATCTCPLLVNIRSSSSHNTTYSAKNCWNKHKHMILIGSSFMFINCTVVNNITKQNNTTLAFN